MKKKITKKAPVHSVDIKSTEERFEAAVAVKGLEFNLWVDHKTFTIDRRISDVFAEVVVRLRDFMADTSPFGFPPVESATAAAADVVDSRLRIAYEALFAAGAAALDPAATAEQEEAAIERMREYVVLRQKIRDEAVAAARTKQTTRPTRKASKK